MRTSFQALCLGFLQLIALLPVSTVREPHRIRNPVPKSVCAVVCFLCLLSSPTAGNSFGRQFKGLGDLIVVYPGSQTAVIDIIEKDSQRILGGKLAPDAILLINDLRADLKDFQIGDRVNVIWKHTESGKEILSLSKNESSTPQPSQSNQNPSSLTDKDTTTSTKITTRQVFSRSMLSQWPLEPIMGTPVYHVVGPKETLLDIARYYDLGFNELADLYPDYDPWLPPEGNTLILPTQRILPEGKPDGIVINIAEMRLYHYPANYHQPIVRSYPVSVGAPPFITPCGSFSIANKVVHPTWFIPTSLRPKYHISSVPPGPDNPLGKYWMGLQGMQLGIHGTDIAWSVGRMVTRGCIRMYPEDIEQFYPTIKVGSTVNLTYQPVKVARVNDRILIEVHRDIYAKMGNLNHLAERIFHKKGLWLLIDQSKLNRAIKEMRGIPVDISISMQPHANTKTPVHSPVLPWLLINP